MTLLDFRGDQSSGLLRQRGQRRTVGTPVSVLDLVENVAEMAVQMGVCLDVLDLGLQRGVVCDGGRGEEGVDLGGVLGQLIRVFGGHHLVEDFADFRVDGLGKLFVGNSGLERKREGLDGREGWKVLARWHVSLLVTERRSRGGCARAGTYKGVSSGHVSCLLECLVSSFYV